MFQRSSFEASGLTVQALADATGVSYSTAWRWLNSDSRPSPLVRQKLRRLGLWADAARQARSHIVAGDA